ncbi:MAG TPA: YicC family protein [Candidatus Butyricicoccus avistercoris]|uniref:YicC family protein n=1 Tax=Candidatus Butyricicoccus avistercoris TaxID=2838518 RepID=A0A9D1TH56_9FIRM|nr:YicC family protein [Candidatus Butyricicoccus avistercoris]
MKSMTGYGRAREASNEREIVVELRAVNHRYLDVNVKAPRGYGFLEEAIKKLAASKISRGKVDVYISVTDLAAQETTITLNHELAQSYFDALVELRDALHLHDDISVMSIAKMPDVLVSQRVEVDADALTASVSEVFNEAVKLFDEMRQIEGEKLADDIRNRMNTIKEVVEQVEIRSPERVTAYREKLEKRMNEILADSTVDEQRILTEAAIFADKTAVDEETVRLRSHLDQLDNMLKDSNPVGRKLDFLVQEMNREANTIGSKANDSILANYVIALKAEIEKIREQIQNIE